MLEVYAYDIRKLFIKDEYEYRFNNASEYRRQKIDNSKSEKVKYEQLAAAAVTDEALRSVGIRECEIEYEFGESGKPYIKGNDIHFNISHSGDYAVCAVSDREVGIDIETIKEAKLIVAKRHFTENEYNYITEQADEIDMADAFFRLWTLKESYVKATGKGISIPFDSFEFDISGETVRFYGEGYEFKEINLGETHISGECEDDRYKLAICVKCACD